MIKKTKTYIDFNGVSRTEDFYFNLTAAEISEMELGTEGTMSEMIKSIVAAQDLPSIIKIFKKLVLKAYGVKSPDGRRFIKTPEITAEFEQTQAYSDIFMELATDAEQASNFFNAIIPQQDNK